MYLLHLLHICVCVFFKSLTNSNAAFVWVTMQTRLAGPPVPEAWPAVHTAASGRDPVARRQGPLAVSPVRTPGRQHRGKSRNAPSLCPAPQARTGHVA